MNPEDFIVCEARRPARRPGADAVGVRGRPPDGGPRPGGRGAARLPCAPGLLLHLLSGSVLLPLGFLALPAHAMPGPPMLRSRLWAGGLWVALETLVAPLRGAGVFNAALGGVPAALRALLGDPDMPIERAREEVWSVLERDLGLAPAGAPG